MTNIFSCAYKQPENKLTYCFLSLLEHLDFRTTVLLLAESSVPISEYERLQVKLLYGGQEANPDGSIVLKGPGRALTVFFENKTWRRPLDIEQIRRHIRVHLNSYSDHHLLVITTDLEHRLELDTLGDPRIHFMTWHQVAASAEKLAREVVAPKDQFLFSQFCEYLDESGEAWRAKMPGSNLLEAHARYLKILPAEERFLEECRRLVNALRDDVVRVFQNEIIHAEPWSRDDGRIGNLCTLSSAPFEQSLLFGIYCDGRNQGITFKDDYQAEFAVFLDIEPKGRDNLAKVQNLEFAISSLKNQGFEFNFPRNECGNSYRLCYWREPMSQHEGATLSDVRTIFETQLRTLFESNFYRIASGQLVEIGCDPAIHPHPLV